MKPKAGLLLLVVVLLAGGVSGCNREAASKQNATVDVRIVSHRAATVEMALVLTLMSEKRSDYSGFAGICEMGTRRVDIENWIDRPQEDTIPQRIQLCGLTSLSPQALPEGETP